MLGLKHADPEEKKTFFRCSTMSHPDIDTKSKSVLARFLIVLKFPSSHLLRSLATRNYVPTVSIIKVRRQMFLKVQYALLGEQESGNSILATVGAQALNLCWLCVTMKKLA
jgi:hypothetical protein